MTACGVKLNAVSFYGGGIKLTSAVSSRRWSVRLAVAAAGCAANLMLGSAAYFMGAYQAAAVNLLICAVNLMPFGKLDGAYIAELVLQRAAPPETAERLMTVVKLISVASVAAVLIFTGAVPDITVVIFCIYLLILDRF